MPEPSPPKRAMCAACLRPGATCICPFVTRVSAAVELLVLQHPMETGNAKGSAQLLHLCLAGSRIASGETFAEGALHELLYGGGRRPVLLYPETPDERSLGLVAPPAFDSRWRDDPASLRLVVLDGTWRKSRKMLYLNPLLQGLPRLPLSQVPPSLYRIRKAHAPDQLSTLEATCYALMQLEQDGERFQPVLDAFERFVGRYEEAAVQHAIKRA
ncbi:tRNA-uridine aminocarboxypropyltransferase [Massilia cavernae]|uniref:tRNA-uridine aminocarboxypropyltransferase n=1 Tax=Massilia cavernae TaxID=2320864 RepID=A0A418Y4Q0_9BURK|nr:tRNA-uridine aminocarboxypropyltransferase [Massilia cavernae]RJG20730.1 DTW domain-containing protein [Massilia cavernae]